MNDEANSPHTPPTRAADAGVGDPIIHPPGARLSEESLEQRERETFQRLVVQAAQRASELVADQRRYKDLIRDRRKTKTHLADIEAEIKEIENRRPRHLLRSS